MKTRVVNVFFRGMRFLFAVFALTAQIGLAQTPGSAYGQPGQIAVTPLARNTPQSVMSGAATVASHYDSNQMLRLVIGLRHPNVASEEQFLNDVQDRSSPLFHQFLTADQYTARFAPSVQDEQAVVDWAIAQGLTVTERYPTRLIVDLQGPVSAIENAFKFTINNYQMGTVSFFSNDRDPAVPTALANVIESVMGANNIEVVGPAKTLFQTEIGGPGYSPGPVSSQSSSDIKLNASAVKPPITNGYYDPADIWASTAYDFAALQNLGHCCNPTHASGQTPPTTSIAIATFSAPTKNVYYGGYRSSDISGFQAQYPYLAVHVSGSHNVDGTPQACCDAETTGDIEFSLAMSNSQGSYLDTAYIVPYVGANNLLGTFADVFMSIETDNQTRILSTSWGCAEVTCWGSGGTSTLHGIVSSMSAQGWTMVAASDDRGLTADCGTISVEYPASDPNIVAVGGTTLFTGPNGFSSETGWQGATYTGACSQNNGGSGGGCSAVYAAPGYQSPTPACGSGSRSVPDIALNASIGENFFFNGTLQPFGGTSMSAPETAGFFAQSAAYVLYITTLTGTNNSCYGTGTAACLPLGNVNTFLYFFGQNPTYPYHYPFYDILTGCDSNDVTIAKGYTPYCAHAGYDLVTGWGSFNALQLSWAINTYLIGNFAFPTIAFSGPTTGRWYNTPQSVSWTITGHTADSNPVNGISGYTNQWDVAIADPRSEPTPGSGNAFYSGPSVPNSNIGSTPVPAIQGCHTLYVYAWDNAGYPSGNQTYGTVCYDSVPPVTASSVSGILVGGEYDGPVTVTLTAIDPSPGSGVAATWYEVNGHGYFPYTGPFTPNGDGTYTINYFSVDIAGNVEAAKTITFTIRSVGAAALQFVPIVPCRVIDTRPGPGFAGGSTNTISVRGSCGIPSSAMAYSVNVTVVPPGPLGYLTIWSFGSPQPFVSTLNSDGRIKANAAIVPAGSDVGGSVNVYVTDPTQFIMDIDGYFTAAGAADNGLQFYPLSPCRVADTRNPSGPLGGPFIPGGTSRAFPVNSTCGIPATAAAYSLNFTAVPHTTLLFLTAWPQAAPQPFSSVLNAPTGTIVANAALIPAGTPNGGVSVYASDDTDVIIDIDGYFGPPSSSGLWLYTVGPCRVIDTRPNAFSGTIAVDVAGSSCAPSLAAQAYVLNATVVPPAPLLYLTLWPDGSPQPPVSTLNANDGAITSNMAIVATTNGKVDAFATSSTNLILDLSGYFAP